MDYPSNPSRSKPPKHRQQLSEMHDALYELGGKADPAAPISSTKLLPKKLVPQPPPGSKVAKGHIARLHAAFLKAKSEGETVAQDRGDTPAEDARERSAAKHGGKVARLTTRARKAIPKKDFAIKGGSKKQKRGGKGRYPIEDRSHARNALARSSGKPEAAAVRRAVAAKYPGMVHTGRARHAARRGRR